jgi:hypothetical protein
MEYESKWRAPTLSRILLEITGLFAACILLNLLVDRLLAKGELRLYIWVILAAEDIITLYCPLLILFWSLTKIWQRGTIYEAHQVAVITTLALVLTGKGLVYYSIITGFSNA